MIDGSGALELADAAVSDTLARLEAMGDVEIVAGKLTAGGVTLNDSTALVDAVKEQHGFGCTIFQANVRIATTAFAAGKNERALGTTANDMVTRLVYRLGQRFEGVTRTIGKDWVIIYVPLRSHAGRIVGMLAAYREIDDFLGDLSLLDDTYEAALLQTPDGRIQDANRAACDKLGLSKPELLGRSMQEFSEAVEDPDMEPVWPALGDEPIESEQRWRASDGHEFVVKQTQSRIERSGTVMGLIIARNFTEEFEARERLRSVNRELKHLNETLEEQVDKRTQSLEEALGELQTTNDALQSTLDELTVAQSELAHFEARVVSKYAIEKLRDPATYGVAFAVGTLINLFGHFLVPYLRGQSDVWANFLYEMQTFPVLGACSIAIAFLFPIFVQTHSAVKARLN
jgi:PAS domain S-box-containing protein